MQSLARSNHISLSSKDNKTTNNTSFCSSCPLGKSKKLPFSNSTHQSNNPLSLVHSDVWTSLVSSISGCRYYVLFVDDFSRYSWIYPLHHKSEVFATFFKFKVHAENLFSCSIKQFQSDNGGEYLSRQFRDFLSKNGICHRLTCPYTSQQNGIAERKHRHVQELGLILLAQSSLKPTY